jgi:hypothetical protein
VARVTQLVYHPAFDAYNALLRIIRILLAAPVGLDVPALRILDFYLLFPEALSDARMTPQLRSTVRRLAAKPRFPYDKVPASKALFERMAAPHEAARQTLVSKGFVVAETGRMVLQPSSTPVELLDLAREQNQNEEDLMSTLTAFGEGFPTNGPNGLKDRSGLLEFRYDVV